MTDYRKKTSEPQSPGIIAHFFGLVMAVAIVAVWLLGVNYNCADDDRICQLSRAHERAAAMQSAGE